MPDGPDEQSEENRCLCPKCHFKANPGATQCPKCGTYFPALADREFPSTPGSFNVFRLIVFLAAVAIGLIGLYIAFGRLFGSMLFGGGPGR